jgi:hypothetical protein
MRQKSMVSWGGKNLALRLQAAQHWGTHREKSRKSVLGTGQVFIIAAMISGWDNISICLQYVVTGSGRMVVCPV